MPGSEHRIYPLDSISQARIKSSVQISSLNNIVIELVKNALDAQAGSISIVLNYCHGFCMVQDDGDGIPAQELAADGKLAQPYCTSKFDRRDKTYGRHGRYLAALSGVALLSISSRCDDQHVHTLWLDDTGRIGHATEDGSDWRTQQGTRVKVYNLFENFPVRSKYSADRFTSTVEVEKEFEQLKYDVTALVLALPRPLDIDIVHSASNCKYRHKSLKGPGLQLGAQEGHRSSEFACSALQQAGYIDRGQCSSCRSSMINSEGIGIYAVLFLDPVPHKHVQFISINHETLRKQTHPPLFNTVNAAFEASSFGTGSAGMDVALSEPHVETEHATRKRTSRFDQRKGVDKWPMFVIWIDTKSGLPEGFLCPTSYDRSTERLVARISTLLELMLKEFLISHDFLSSSTKQKPRQSLAVTTSNNSLMQVSGRGHSFESWSRIKSSRGRVPDNVLSGLPFQNRKQDKVHTPPEATTVSKAGLPITTSPSVNIDSMTLAGQESVISWTDPKTDKLVRIDPRTGMALPDSNYLPESHQASVSYTKMQGGAPLSHIAQKVKQYAQSRHGEVNLPIRSITLFDDRGQGFQEQVQTKNKKPFWELPDGDHRADSHFEMPPTSKGALKDAIVLGQLDKKFILSLLPCVESDLSHKQAADYQLVLIDQHAADERVKVEQLMRTFHDKTVTLDKPITFEVSMKEASLLEATKSSFEEWHILYNVTSTNQPPIQTEVSNASKQQIKVTALPSVIVERCRLKPKLIIDLLREEIWSENKQSTTSSAHRSKRLKPEAATENSCCYGLDPSHNKDVFVTAHMPPRLLDLLNSRACRSAIMFNDELTPSQCTKLVTSLSKCTLPFQCAHGRPSMVVLADLSSLREIEPCALDAVDLSTLVGLSGGEPDIRRMGLNMIDETRSFGDAYRDWHD